MPCCSFTPAMCVLRLHRNHTVIILHNALQQNNCWKIARIPCEPCTLLKLPKSLRWFVCKSRVSNTICMLRYLHSDSLKAVRLKRVPAHNCEADGKTNTCHCCQNIGTNTKVAGYTCFCWEEKVFGWVESQTIMQGFFFKKTTRLSYYCREEEWNSEHHCTYTVGTSEPAADDPRSSVSVYSYQNRRQD